MGWLDDIVLGFGELSAYVRDREYFGVIVGRIAGRIATGRMIINGRLHFLSRNEGNNHLHGGCDGFGKRIWTAQPLAADNDGASLRLTYRSEDGEEGYPGSIAVSVTYSLTDDNAVKVECFAVAEKETPLSISHHSYFNLAGEQSRSVLDHEVQVVSSAYVPMNDDLTLAGRHEAVHGGNDLNHPRRIADALPKLFKSHGDLYLIGDSGEIAAPAMRMVARVNESRSGRLLEVSTDEQYLQFYTGVFLGAGPEGKSDRRYGPHAGFCLECQGYPEGARWPVLGNILLRPGQNYHRTTIYAFSVR